MGNQYFSTPVLCVPLPSLTPASAVLPIFLLACRSVLFLDSLLVRTTEQKKTKHSSSAKILFSPVWTIYTFLHWLCAFHHFSSLKRWILLGAETVRKIEPALQRLTQLPSSSPLWPFCLFCPSETLLTPLLYSGCRVPDSLSPPP